MVTQNAPGRFYFPEYALVLNPSNFTGNFEHLISTSMDKISGLSSGSFETTIRTADIPDFDIADNLRIAFEASTRQPMTHDYPAEESGSYGTLCDITIPSALLFKLKEKESFTLTLTMKDDKGLSLYSRTSRRYGLGIVIEAL